MNDTGAPADTSMPDTSSPPDTSDAGSTPATVEAGCGGAVGCACSGAASCTSDVCGDQESVTSGLYSAAGNANFCTQPCCTSSDCPAGTVCFAHGRRRQLLRAAPVGGADARGPAAARAAPAAGPGATAARGCARASHCVDTCCSNRRAASAAAAASHLLGVPGHRVSTTHYTANCGTSGGSGANGHSCSVNGDCESQICAAIPCSAAPTAMPPVAARPTAPRAAAAGGPCACEYVLANSNADPGRRVLQLERQHHRGDSCSTTNDTCATGFCDPNSMKCTSVCFTDADCTTSRVDAAVREQVTVSGGGSYSVLACGT